MTVFFQNIEKSTWPRNTAENALSTKDKLDALRRELSNLEQKPPQNIEERKRIQREIKRLERLDALMEWRWIDEKNKKDITEILKWKNGENIKNSDILTLRKKWVDIANLTLIDDKNPDNEIVSANIKEGDTFTVNFGDNKNLRDRTGAGDILPANIKTITINGVECERRNTPRPGYYNDSMKPSYQRIYDGYMIIILALGPVNDNDNKAIEDQWKRERLNDMEDNDWNPLTTIEEDVNLRNEYTKRQEERRVKRERYSNYNPENKDKFMSTFGDIVKRETEKYWIPENILVDNLFAKENSSFNPNLKNPYSSALWFGQIINSTWRQIESSILFEDLDRYDPEDQIRATCAYLNYIKDLKNCSWWDAVVYYHTWPGFNNSNVQTAMSVNPAIVAHMSNTGNPTARDYIEWAKKYYWINEQA